MARVVILPYNCPDSTRTLTSSSKQPRNAWRARLKFFHPDRQVSLKQTPEGINRGYQTALTQSESADDGIACRDISKPVQRPDRRPAIVLYDTRATSRKLERTRGQPIHLLALVVEGLVRSGITPEFLMSDLKAQGGLP